MMLDEQLMERDWAADVDDDDEEPAPTRVLVVEDDEELRALIAHALRREGYAVFELSDGDRLLKYIHGMRHGEADDGDDVDLVISDVRLPGRSGLDALEELRERDRGLPMILMTAFPGPELREAVDRAGAAVIFDKPFDLEDLCTAANYFAATR